MSLEAAFLGDITERPDEDAPRLVYADWLEERGDPRGEFIRLQCKLAPLADDDPQRPSLERRERELLAEHEEHWLRPFDRKWRGWLGGRVPWRRGFVESVQLSVAEFLANAPAIFATGPIRCVQLKPEEEEGRSAGTQLARCAYLERLQELSLIYGPFGDQGLRALAGSPHVRNLRSLALVDCQVGAVGTAALANSPYLKQLRQLDLSSVYIDGPSDYRNHVGTKGVHALVWSAHLPALQSLGLAGNDLNIVAVRTLGAGPVLGQLTDLDLAANSTGMRGLSALVRSPRAKTLRTLTLDSADVGQAELRELAGSPHLSSLQKLTLGQNPIEVEGLLALTTSAHLPALTALLLFACPNLGREGLDLLLRSPLLDRLTELNLSDQGLTSPDAQALAFSPRIARLQHLDLSSNRIGDVGLRALVVSPHPAGLTELDVACADIGPGGIRTLTETQGLLSTLRILNLDCNNIGTEGAGLLAASPQTARLRKLCLHGNGISDLGAQALADSPYLQSLKELTLYGRSSNDKRGDEVVRRLHARWGKGVMP